MYTDKIVVKGRDFINQKWVLEKTVSLTGENINDSSDNPSDTKPNSSSTSEKEDSTTMWIIVGVCAVTLIVVAIAIGVVVSSKKKGSGNEK